MTCQTVKFSQLCTLVSLAERHHYQIRNGETQSDRDIATVGLSRTLDQIYVELRALKKSGTLDALDMLVHTLDCQALRDQPV